MSDFSFTGSGTLLFVGEADFTSSNWNYEADGQLNLTGDALYKVKLSYISEGQFGNSGEAKLKVKSVFSQEVKWNLRSYFEISKSVKWDVGDLPTRIFQVQGACRFPTCNDLPISTDDTQCAGALGKNQFIQTIFAKSLKGVCDFLIDSGWKWPIASIKKFNQTLDSLVVENGEVPPNCNELKSVEFCNIPECFEFCLQTDGISNLGMSFEVIESIYRFEASGKITFSGTNYEPKRFIGSGNINLSGDAEYSASTIYLEYQGDGNIGFSGEAELVFDKYSYIGNGNLILSGLAEVISPRWKYRGNGNLILSNSANFTINRKFIGNGNLIFNGSAEYPILVIATGKLNFSGTSISSIIKYNYISEGELIFSGISSQISPDWHYEGDQ